MGFHQWLGSQERGNTLMISTEDMKQAADAFYFGDIGSHEETGFKLLHKDENTLNMVGKVLTTLVEKELGEGMNLESTITDKLQAIRNQYPQGSDLMDDEDLILFCLSFFTLNWETIQEMEEIDQWEGGGLNGK